MQLFGLQFEAFLLTIWSSLLTVVHFSFSAYTRSFFTYNWSSCWSSFACNGIVCLIRSSSVDCKQRSSTVSKKAPTVSRKASPLFRISDPEGPTIKINKSCSKLSISIEISNLARKCLSRRLDFPTKNRAAMGGSLENFILARNVQSRSKSRIFFDLWALWGFFWVFEAGAKRRAQKEEAEAPQGTIA